MVSPGQGVRSDRGAPIPDISLGIPAVGGWDRDATREVCSLDLTGVTHNVPCRSKEVASLVLGIAVPCQIPERTRAIHASASRHPA
jgi:hypothetical protein